MLASQISAGSVGGGQHSYPQAPGYGSSMQQVILSTMFSDLKISVINNVPNRSLGKLRPYSHKTL